MNSLKFVLSKIYLLQLPVIIRFIPQSLFKIIFLFSIKGMGIENYDTTFKSETKVYQRLGINERGTIFDVGANVGAYRDFVMSLYPKSNLYCFEPHPLAFQELKKTNIEKRAKIVNLGFDARKRTTRIYDYNSQSSHEHASVFSDVITDIHHKEKSSYIVSLDTIDHFCEKNHISVIELLKVDTEGNELNVLKGASKMLAKGNIKIIHFEFNRMNVVSRSFFKDFCDLLHGYEIYRIVGSELRMIDKYDPLYCEIFGYQNYLAMRKPILS